MPVLLRIGERPSSRWILAKKGWCFAALVSFAEIDKKAMSYVRWLIGSYASPPVLDPENQAEDFGTYARACGIQPKSKGYARGPCWRFWDFLLDVRWSLGVCLQSIAL